MSTRLQTSVASGATRLCATVPSGLLQRQCACGQHTAGGQCEHCKNKRMTLQRKSEYGSAFDTVPPIVHKVLRSPGQPLDAATRAFMEPRFRHDFSQVRVHEDAHAAKSVGAVNALAYTVGQDVVFGTGQYAPQSETGRHLLAHELTHVVQQASGDVNGDAERRAEASAALVLRGEPHPTAMAGGSTLSLQKAGKDDVTGTQASTPASDSSEAPIDEFGFDKADIPPQHLARLTELRSHLAGAPGATVTLVGHTDTVGTEKYNQGLGQRRAAAVRDYLTKQNGVNSNRIKIETKGETEPAAGEPPAKLDPNKGEKNPKNRRVEIRVTGFPPTPAPAPTPTQGWTFDPTDPNKKKPPIDLNLPKDYKTTPGGDTPAPSSSAESKKEGGLGVERSVVFDPNAKPEKGSTRVGRTVETQIEISYKESTGIRKILPKVSLTVHVGPNGFEELEAELTLLRQKLKSLTLGETVSNVEVSVSFNPGFNLDKSTANRLIPDFAAKVKAALSADLGIPGTSITIPIEASVYVDPLGKPGGELKITLFKF